MTSPPNVRSEYQMSVEVTTDRARLDVAMIHRFLSKESYWARDISLPDVENGIANSLCFGVYVDNTQVGFARVISDFVRFAHVLDVFVVKEHRGSGYGKLLMKNILSHPALSSVSRFSLGTADAHGLYAQFGFTTPTKPETLMELIRPKADGSGT